MATSSQIRGLLLEECVLHLLRATGYRVVEGVGDDPTLQMGNAGINVHGRGSDHQIDALADFLAQQPFSNPQRLLLEAKCLDPGTNVGLPIVRNAFGTLADVSQFWTTEHLVGEGNQRNIAKSRYHYHYAIFSATGYTAPAESYAFAQDIYLIPLAKSAFFQPIIREIRAFPPAIIPPGEDGIQISLIALRRRFRRLLNPNAGAIEEADTLTQGVVMALNPLLEVCRGINQALLATLGGRFPVFLVPAAGIDISTLETRLNVTITFDEEGWYLNRRVGDEERQKIFSFDLPEELFRLYARDGRLSQREALNLKEQIMSSFQAVRSLGNNLQIIQFDLEPGWINRVRTRLGIA